MSHIIRERAPNISVERGWRIHRDDSESRNENDNRHSNSTLKTKFSVNSLPEEAVEIARVDLRDVTPVVGDKELLVAPPGSKGEATGQSL